MADERMETKEEEEKDNINSENENQSNQAMNLYEIKDFDKLLNEHVGSLGRWQWFVFLLLLGPMNVPYMISPAFTEYVPPHRCFISPHDDVVVGVVDNISSTSTSINDNNYFSLINISIPLKLNSQQPPMIGQAYEPCKQWLFNNQSQTMEIIDCKLKQYRFDHSENHMIGTTIEDFQLVCDQQYLGPLTVTINMIAQLLGTLSCGIMADYWGRKPILTICGFILWSGGLIIPLATNIYFYLTMRFILGFCALSTYMSGTVLLAEITTHQWRPLFTVLTFIMFAFGSGSFLTIASYLLHNWRYLYLTMAITFCSSSLLFYPYLSESPRWLLTQGRFEEAFQLLFNAAKLNQRGNLNLEQLKSMNQTNKTNNNNNNNNNKKKSNNFRTGLIKSFTTPELRKRTLLLMIVWFQHGLIYYILTFYSVRLKLNPYLAFWIMVCVISLPAQALQYALNYFFGRKLPLLLLLLFSIPIYLSAFFYLVFRTEESTSLDLPVVVAACLCKLIIGCTFGMVYVYTPELLPTESRNYLMGLVNAFSRVGSSVAPFVVHFTLSMWAPLPMILAPIVTLASVLSLIFLPETKFTTLPDTADQLRKPNLNLQDDKNVIELNSKQDDVDNVIL